MKTITFYSYKGGTGRSLALANAARYLARLEFKVVALDFDLEAPGLHYKFSTGPAGDCLPIERGIVDYLHQFIVEGEPPDSLKEFVVDIKTPGIEKPLIHLIPAGKVMSADYWPKLSRINWHELFYSDTAQGVQIFLDLKNRIEDEIKPDFLLIDSRTGITEMGGVATTLLADSVICLVLPAPENLEGARAVLRSLKKSRRDFGLPPVNVMVVLSRLPEMGNEDEEEWADRIRTVLNEEAEKLENTLGCTNVFVLHSELSLQVHEALRVGSGVSLDDSILLRDYLRLFSNATPKEMVEPRIEALIEQAKNKIWTDPDAALKEVEDLAESFGHPEIYRVLLRFYEIRNVVDDTALKFARRLWETTHDSHEPFLWNALKRVFSAKQFWQVIDADEIDWMPKMEFIESVWRYGGERELGLGSRLAEFYAYKNEPARAADVLLELINNKPTSPDIVADCIRHLDNIGRTGEAAELIHRFKNVLAANANYLAAWASHALQNQDEQSFTELTASANLVLLKRAHPLLATRLLIAVGRLDETNTMAEKVLEGILKNSGPGARKNLEEIARIYTQLGRWDEFVSKAHQKYSTALLDQIREQIALYPSFS